jgi:hypothetical protein
MHADWWILSRIKKLSLDDLGSWKDIRLIRKYLQDHHINLKYVSNLLVFECHFSLLKCSNLLSIYLNLRFYFQVQSTLFLDNTIPLCCGQYKFDVVYWLDTFASSTITISESIYNVKLTCYMCRPHCAHVFTIIMHNFESSTYRSK